MVGEVLLGGVAYEVIHSAHQPVLVVRIEKKPEAGVASVQAIRSESSGHVLFPTDFSGNADLAFTYVETMAERGVRRITLLHVTEVSRIDPEIASDRATLTEIDRARLEHMKTSLERSGKAEIAIELRYGSPTVQIARLVRERDLNLVAMGHQGRGFVDEVFLGSVSHNVVRNFAAPVLLIPARRSITTA
jgi:nucleotide-binding universal stress UspA family protein